MCRSTIIDNPATLRCSGDSVKAKLHIASFAHPAIRLIGCVFKQFIDIDKLRSSISNKIVETDRLRKQVRDSRAPVNLDQQFVGRLSPIRAIQQHKMSTANNAGRQNRHAVLLWRGFSENLSKMRKTPFLRVFLKPQAMCTACSKNFSFISGDDGPAWLTLLIVGYLVAPLMLVFGRSDFVPPWLAVLILSVISLIGIYLVLPRAKGIFIVLIWLTDATGQNEFSDTPDLQD